jgi:hypothetical protein
MDQKHLRRRDREEKLDREGFVVGIEGEKGTGRNSVEG